MAKSNPDIWMPLYIGDYLAATSHLGALESGAYLHLLMHQWKNGRLPAVGDGLRRIAKVDSDAWSNAWAVLEHFFDYAEGYPVQLRMEEIRAEWVERKQKSSEKASAAAKARWKDAPSNAQAMPQTCPSTSTSPIASTKHKELSPKNASSIAEPTLEELQGTGISLEDYRSYQHVRKFKKSPFLDIAARDKWIALWKKYYTEGKDTADMIGQMIVGNWIGPVPEKWNKRPMSVEEKYRPMSQGEVQEWLGAK